MRMFELAALSLAENLLDELDVDWTLGGEVLIADAENARSAYLALSAEKIRLALLTTASASFSAAEDIAREQVEETLTEVEATVPNSAAQYAWNMCAATAGIIGDEIARMNYDMLEMK